MAPFNGLIPETAIPSLPYLFRDADHLHAVLDGEIGERDPRRPSSRTA